MDFKQTIRLKNTLLAAVGGAVLSMGILYAYFLDRFAFSFTVLVVSVVVFWVVNLAIIGSIYKGYNLHFKDPSMSSAQMHWASLASILVLAVTQGLDGLFYLQALLPMVFGVFRLPVKAYKRYAYRIIVILFAAIIVRDLYVFPSNSLSSDLVVAFGFTFCVLTLSSLCRSVVRMQDRLREKNQALEDALVARSNFLANMSHEIRTPMNGVLGMVDLCLQHSLESQTRYNLMIAKESGKGLLAVINDILDFSKMDAGKLEIVPKAFALHSFVEHLMLPFKAAATQKGVSFSLHLNDNLPKCIFADNLRIQQVLNNLIGNAIKFTVKGHVRVSVKLGAYPTSSERAVDLEFLVEDSGIGIKHDRLNELFESFSQADASTTREFGGTGLGLAIASELVQLMGGRIFVSSELGVGTTFKCVIPVELASECDIEPPETGELRKTVSSQRRFKALLVEDNVTNQEVARTTLNIVGVDAVVAANGEQALQILSQAIRGNQIFDIIFMDCQMPVMDGYETARRIRTDSFFASYAKTPIIALTAHAMADDRERCLQAGMSDFLTKPIECAAVANMVDRWLRWQGEGGSAPIKSVKSDSAEASTTPGEERELLSWDEQALVDVFGDQSDTITELLTGFEKSLNKQVDSVLSAIEQGDLDSLRAQIHELKGVSANLKFERMARVCKVLEDKSQTDEAEVSSDELRTFLDEVSEVKRILERETSTSSRETRGAR